MSKIAGLLPLAASRDQTLTRISPIAVCSDVLVEAVIEWDERSAVEPGGS